MRRDGLFSLSGIALSLSCLANFSGQVVSSPVDAACCYFAAKDKDINQPGQKAFISWNAAQKMETFTVQPKFEGNAVDFGMVIPTPARPKLDEMPRDFFKDLAMFTILMPLPQPIYGPGDVYPMQKSMRSAGKGMVMNFNHAQDGAVKVLESGVVGSLDYKIIVASDATGLFQWLKDNEYTYGGDEATLKFYIDKKWFFTVMKIDPAQMKKDAGGNYTGEVTPTKFSFHSDKCTYPLKITQLSVKDHTDALFYVQSPSQMDLPGDWSWMPSYRSMYLTYMLGCCANPEQQSELARRRDWLSTMQRKDGRFQTTKLEWSKKLGAGEMSVLDDPKANYGQMGSGDLPEGAKVIALPDFLAQMKQSYEQAKTPSDAVKTQLARMEDQYQPSRGSIVKYDEKTIGKGFIYTHFAWYPNREAPYEEIKGLTILKGHLQKDQWLTKFRKEIRKDEMTQDLVLAEVPKEEQQTYTRIMPTSPP